MVAEADIDGDGKADQVGVVAKGITEQAGGTIAVRVRTAVGKTLQTTGSDVSWYYQPFHGLAAIDGRAGKEIVVGDLTGAHSFQWRVVTYRKGALVTLAPPPGSGLTRPSRWATDGSYSFHYGWARRVSDKGVVTLVRKEAVRDETGPGATGRTNTYQWKSGAWVKRTSTKKHYPSLKAAAAIDGWHVKGLPVWPAEV